MWRISCIPTRLTWTRCSSKWQRIWELTTRPCISNQGRLWLRFPRSVHLRYYPAAGDWRTDTVNPKCLCRTEQRHRQLCEHWTLRKLSLHRQGEGRGTMFRSISAQDLYPGFLPRANQQVAALNPAGAPTVCDSPLFCWHLQPVRMRLPILQVAAARDQRYGYRHVSRKVYGNQYYIVLRQRNSLETWVPSLSPWMPPA